MLEYEALEKKFLKSNNYYANLTIVGFPNLKKDIPKGWISFDFGIRKTYDSKQYQAVIDEVEDLIAMYEERYQKGDMLAALKLACLYSFGVRFFFERVGLIQNIANYDLLQPVKGYGGDKKYLQYGQNIQRSNVILQDLTERQLYPEACLRFKRFNNYVGEGIPQEEKVKIRLLSR